MDKTISLAEAFAHCASTTAYWVWIIIPVVLGLILVPLMKYEGKKYNKDVDNAIKWVVIALIFFLFAAIFMRPTDVAANTTVEMAAKGHYLGY